MHFAELPGYLLVLIALIEWLGIKRAAIAWCIRVAVDAGALFWLARRVGGEGLGVPVRLAALPVSLLMVLRLWLATTTPALKTAIALAFFGVFAVVVWRWGLRPDHRTAVLTRLRHRDLGHEPGGD